MLVPVLAGAAGTARAAAGGAGHADPFAGILLELALLILAAMLGRWAAGRLGQPSVLGELLISVLIGNVLYAAGGPLAILIMHANLAGNIVRGVWDSGLSVAEVARGFMPPEQLQAGSPGAEVLAVLEALFAPVFFILRGMQVNLAAFLDPDTLGLAAALVVVATLGKAITGVVAGPGVDRLSVGLGMVPRGEVGLIFVSIGKGLGVVSGQVFSAVVIMVIVTTLITPLGLRWSLGRRERES